MKNTSRVLLWIVLIFGAIVLIALWGGTFSGTTEEININPSENENEVVGGEAAALAAKEELAALISIDANNINTAAIESREWPNSCLGLEGEDELCAQVIIPGYLVTLEVDGNTYFYRTDENGDLIRQEPNKESVE